MERKIGDQRKKLETIKIDQNIWSGSRGTVSRVGRNHNQAIRFVNLLLKMSVVLMLWEQKQGLVREEML